ncbi:putative sulfatase [Colletotrichum orbiculare MAFF 240422]|uniref:Sulfatase n=1 Tax=Colletotrichum orbiculare (strain 104-T / ATCC 96160 / CBS 514.97 / LARS 414 / MAFF 240422) TaxID=1213857 RepID=A0A484FVP4_COLOR|nr:putative sulfatase [Colletotrichum orbiculare MAFF 240422]
MTTKRQNFLIIVADDLGFSDISPYGGEINTHVLEKLAKDGIRMTNLHTASACSPTRSMLFSGTDSQIAGLGQMFEHMRRFGDYFKDRPGYEGYLNWRVALSEILQDTGYHTIMSGKRQAVKRLVELGLVDKGIEHAPPTGVVDKEWKDMTDLERKESARKVEVFAAMVELIDENIGRVIEHLTSTGELDNTFILFMSDNGAEGAALEAIPMMGGETTFAGSSKSARWASAATAPSRRSKCWVTEGGIRCPCVIRVMDVLPPILELARVQHPGTSFRGRDVVVPRGKSWVGRLSSPDHAAPDSTVHVHGWELFDHWERDYTETGMTQTPEFPRHQGSAPVWSKHQTRSSE